MVTPYSGGPSSFELLALPSGILDYFLRSVLDGADRARMRFMCRAVRERLRFYPLMELPDTILDHFLLKTLGAEEKTSVMTASKALLARFRAAADRVARSAGGDCHLPRSARDGPADAVRGRHAGQQGAQPARG